MYGPLILYSAGLGLVCGLLILYSAGLRAIYGPLILYSAGLSSMYGPFILYSSGLGAVYGPVRTTRAAELEARCIENLHRPSQYLKFQPQRHSRPDHRDDTEL